MTKNQERGTLSFSYGNTAAHPIPVPEVITEQSLAKLAVPVARRLAFVRVVLAAGVALLLTALALLVSGYLGEGPGSAGALAVALVFGALMVATAGICSWVFGARRPLRRPKHIWPSKTPETVMDAWLGVGIMAAIVLAILVLVAIFGGDSWEERAHSVLTALPFATLGPGIVSGMFLITGYTVGNQDAIFQRWLRKRPVAAAEYAELRSHIQDPKLPRQ